MKFTVPGEPVGKQRPRVVRKGSFVQTYTPEKTVSYENLVKLEFAQAFPGFTPYPKDVPLEVTILAKFKTPGSVSKKRRLEMLNGVILPTKPADVDNIAKIVLDALHDVCYLNDSCVVKLNVKKVYSEAPSVDVEIREVEGANSSK